MSAHKDSSSLRYFFAGLKPLGRPMFWLPMGLLSLILLGYWQYQQNPQWLGITPGQPEISIENEVPPEVANPEATTEEDLPALDTDSPSRNFSRSNRSPSDSETTDNTVAGDPLAPFKPKTDNNNRKSSLFLPLLPAVKPNSNVSPSKSLQPIQVAPVTENNSDSPLQKAIDNLSRDSGRYPSSSPTDSNSALNNPNRVPATSIPSYQSPVSPATGYQPYGNTTNPGQGIDRVPTLGNQPNPTAYPNQGAPSTYSNPNPYPVSPQSQPQTRGYTIQRPIDAPSSGY